MKIWEYTSVQEYKQLRDKVAPRDIPSMCFLTVKHDYNMIPHRALSLIMILGNHKYRYREKNEFFSLIISYSPLLQLAILSIEHKRLLQQGKNKNAFYNAILTKNETTIIKPTIGYPFNQPDELQHLYKNLYGIQLIPRHWFDNLTSTLKNMGLMAYTHEPCLYKGFLTPGGGSKLYWPICWWLSLL